MRRVGTRGGAAVVLALVLGLATGCGSSEKAGDEAGNGAIGADTGTRAERAAAAGEQAAKDAGGPVTLPAKKAGILQIIGSVESAQRAERAMRQAIEALTWTAVVCDAQGDPVKMAKCGDSLLDRNVDVMFTIGIEPGVIKAQLRKAKAKNVPVVGTTGQVSPDPLWAGTYFPDDEASGGILSEYVMKRLGDVEGTKEVAISSYPAEWSRLRTDEFRTAIDADPTIETVVDQTVDATNLVEGTRKQVSDTLTAHPGIKAYWFGQDSSGQVGGQVIASKFAGKSFPDRPLAVTFDANLSTQDLIRDGAVDAVVDVAYDATAWVAADQAAQFFARDTPFDTSAQPDYPVTFFDNVIVTKENLPPKGEYREPKDDFVTFFTTKWDAEFGGGA
jgi:ABC-type sugar transport system substrate-binding protein